MERFVVTRFYFLFLWAVAGLLKGQASEAEFLVRVWQSDDGLPGNVVRSIGQTPDGFLWVSTAEGLARFDGLRFETIVAPGIGEGPQLALGWIFTPKNGEVWVGSAKGGLFRVKGSRLLRVLDDNDEGAETDLVYQVVSDGDDVVIVREGRIVRYSDGIIGPVNQPSTELLKAISEDARLSRRRGRSSDPRLPFELTDRSGRIWRAVDGGLAFRKDKDAAEVLVPVPGRSRNLATQDLFQDREGNIWVASTVEGLIQLRERRVVQLRTDQGPVQNAVKTMLLSRSGEWWIAPWAGGLFRIEDGLMQEVTGLSNGLERTVVCLHEDSRGRIWICAQGGSVLVYSDGGLKVFETAPMLSKVEAMAEDSLGNIWFGGKNGLFRWDGTVMKDFGGEPLLDGGVFTSMEADSDGRIYAGTIDGRVYVCYGDDISILGAVGTGNRCRISTILAMDSGVLWVSTIGSGIFVFRKGEWHSISRRAGLPDDRITALVQGPGDSMWMGSLSGIIMASRQAMLDWAIDGGALPAWLTLDRSDGLMTSECSGASQPGAVVSPEGGVWFPTNAGPAGVRQKAIEIIPVPPPIHITGVEVGGVPVDVGSGGVAAGPGRPHVALRFRGVSLSSPEKVTYLVRMSGLEEEFRFIGTQDFIHYDSIPAGRYSFEVLATNGDGVRSSGPAALTVDVRPHLWETAGFMVGSVIAAFASAVGIGWQVERRRARRKLQELQLKGALQAERSRISRDLHDDIGSGLTELSLRTQLAAESAVHESEVTAFREFADDARSIAVAMDEIVWATNPNKDSLRSLIEYVAFSARRFMSSVGIPLHAEIVRNPPDIVIGPRRRHNVFLASREAVNNAVKHARPSRVDLKIVIEQEMLIIQIRDHGKGFDKDFIEEGNGLKNLRDRMAECDGNCSVESVMGKGTIVRLSLPLTTKSS